MPPILPQIWSIRLDLEVSTWKATYESFSAILAIFSPNGLADYIEQKMQINFIIIFIFMQFLNDLKLRN
jgi:hypothetical protein